MHIPSHLLNYIGGEFIPPSQGIYFPVFNPANGIPFTQCPDSTQDDLDMAVQAAKKAKYSWANTPGEKRFIILNKFAELIDQNRDILAQTESNDQGKPLWLAKNEMIRAAQNFRFFATAAHQFASESHSMESHALNYTLRQPIGLVGCISPWNLPLYLFTWKIAPALAAGNCVIAKPSEITPCTAFLLSHLAQEAGLPPGVLNILHGTGQSTGQALISHPEIKAISFTGGTVTGKKIMATAGPMFKKLSLELGGKNANVIFEDANLEEAIKTSVQSSFLNQGEICLCGSRIYIQRSIYDIFKEKFIQQVKELVVGDPSDPKTKVGAIVSQGHFNKVMDAIRLAKEEGGIILTGGNAISMAAPFNNGWFIEPTVIEGLTAQCKTQQEEIFGPVVTLTPFDNEEEAIQLANGTEYGLASVVWTENINRATRVAQALESGIVWVNCWLLRDLRTPFGGMKQSGIGREGGWEAMRFFTEPKNVCIKMYHHES